MWLEPDLWIPHLFLGWCLDAQGRYDEALQSLETALRLSSNVSGCLASTARCLAAGGDHRGALRILEELEATAEQLYVAPVRIARVYLALNRVDDAFVGLDRACLDRSIHNNMYLPYDYGFAPVRNDPRFVRLLREHLSL